jgi:gas vesicle protein
MSDRMYYSQEAEQRARREKLMLILLTTGLSVTIGALIAMLFAPQTGDEFREQVGDTIAKGRKLAENASDRVVEQAGKLREEAQERLMD